MLDSDPSWDTLADGLIYNDDTKIHNCDRNLDNLLVFTGLFSAVVAAFTIESYTRLQEDPAEVTAMLLSQISLQLGLLNSSSATQLSSVFQASKGDVRLNTLWFLSLVLSLIVASLTIFVRQWLREYLNWECSSATERIRLRHVRYEGLLRWRVFEIAGLLPFLLQVSLLLFLIGLSDFLRQLHPIVGWCITGLIILWMSIFAATLVAPILFVDCPYKIPLFMRGIRRLHRAFADLRLHLGFDWKSRLANRYYTYPGDEKGIRRDVIMDLDALVSADIVLADDHTLEKCICNCAKSLSLDDAASFCRRVLSRYLDTKIESLSNQTLDFGVVPSRALNALMGLICNIMPPGDEQYDLLTQNSSPLLELVTFLYHLCNHAIERNRGVYLSNWRVAKSAIHQVPITLLRSGSSQVIESLLKIMASSPYMLITAPAAIPIEQIKNLVRAANELLSQKDSVHPLSLSRAVLEYISDVDSGDLDECREELVSFSHTMVDALQEREPTIFYAPSAKDVGITMRSDDRHSDFRSTEAKRSLVAITKLNKGTQNLIPNFMEDALKRRCVPERTYVITTPSSMTTAYSGDPRNGQTTRSYDGSPVSTPRWVWDV
ncbi:hypothetical protein QCA50_011648 [Cerrena zonata]|uniref:DUF6535 domain-containing protein n=1 Tax=Cerrena zonata TaxID=2478898 RepID=A0AAW0G8C1_9APHY